MINLLRSLDRSFFANFAMAVAAIRPIQGIVMHLSPMVAGAQSITFHAISMFIQDCKDLVTSNVTMPIKQALHGINEHQQPHAECCKLALSAWNKCQHPLVWTNEGGPHNGTYQKLITLLNKNMDEAPSTLPEAGENLRYHQLTSKLYKMGHAEKPLAVVAPITANGAFIHALGVAIKVIGCWAQCAELAEAFTISIFETMLSKMQIQFARLHNPGGRAYTVWHDRWLILQRAPAQGAAVLMITDSEERESASGIVASQAADTNKSVPWTIPANLSNMGVLWEKTVLPCEWELKHASLDQTHTKAGAGYIWDTYSYVFKEYDGNVWWHNMSLVWVILFTKMAPHVFMELDKPLEGRNEKELTAAVCQMPWVET